MSNLLKLQGGWLARYLQFRSTQPFPSRLPAIFPPPPPPDEEALDRQLYAKVHETGMLLGCPVVSAEMQQQARSLRFPEPQGGTLFLFLETLLRLVREEEELIQTPSHPIEVRTTWHLVQLLQYFLPESYYQLPTNVPLPELLQNSEVLHSALHRVEKALLEEVAIAGYSSDPRQNAFVFLHIYTFLRWQRALRLPAGPPLAVIRQQDMQFRKELLLALIALIWADDQITDIERQVITNYLDQSGLPFSVRREMLQHLQRPYRLELLRLERTTPILRQYLIEQMILLSLIDNSQAREELELIAGTARQLGTSEEELELIYAAVADFFSRYASRFTFLHNNPAVRQMQEYVEENVIKVVKLNLGRIIREIQETRELYDLLIKAGTTPLTEEERRRVNEQIKDILKAIPALALFALPGGSLLLPVVIKLLPFNILPSSFQEAPEGAGARS
ncbi:MAG: LETM1 domain-containing protein [bacterium]